MAKRKPKSGSLFDGDADVVDTTPARRRGPGGRPSARGGPGPLPQLRTLGHHLARPARRARRAEAGAAPHPLHDVAAEPHRRRQAPQVRQGRRRRDGQLPPARRLGALRNARPHGAGLLAALPAGRRLRQLRLARWRSRRGHALYRVPPRAPQRRDAARDRSGHGGVPAELRRHAHRAGRAAGEDSEPARQRRHRHRRRHGDQHPAAQPRRGVHGARQAARQPRPDRGAAVPLRQRHRTFRPAARSSTRPRS